jgi:hypothetical protein
MADYDVHNDITPNNVYDEASLPTITALKASLTAFSASSYTADRLLAMSEQDLIYACRLHGLTPVGL